ncbi:MAG: FIST C-terminal domain-containing protein [Betaproteobacteria bacterium]|nr:FIST C-terminal domain-containing protein [Betaproteobacteria bacterium]
MSAIEVRFGKSFHPDAQTAVYELAAQTSGIDPDFLIFFCSPKYDLPALGKAIKAVFDCPAIGCTTAGEILGSAGYIEGSIVCAAISSGKLAARLFFIKDLRAFANDQAPLEKLPGVDRKRSFALFLIDGLSMLEEPVVARINQTLKGVPLIGASAADGLSFEHAYVYHDGAFHQNAAMLAIVETSLPFLPLHIQHFEPTEKRFVITAADPLTRTVTEINGLPAVGEYARAVGMSIDTLGAEIFTAHPVMLKVGGKYHVRTIKNANPDGSLSFFCAIDSGIVLTVAKPSGSPTENLENNLNEIRKTIPNPALIFGSDCMHRRLEMQRDGNIGEANSILSHYPFIGFSTYGEQFYGVHVNYTLTALVLGNEM